MINIPLWVIICPDGDVYRGEDDESPRMWDSPDGDIVPICKALNDGATGYRRVQLMACDDERTLPARRVSRMQALIDSFPSLRQAGCQWRGDTCRDFVAQAKQLHNVYDRQAAAFICYVWNKYEAPKGLRFDFQAAIDAWDQPHIEALRAWLRDPWYA